MRRSARIITGLQWGATLLVLVVIPAARSGPEDMGRGLVLGMLLLVIGGPIVLVGLGSAIYFLFSAPDRRTGLVEALAVNSLTLAALGVIGAKLLSH